MNKRVLKTLEYYKITGRLTKYASSREAAKRFLNMYPSSDVEWVRTRLAETGSAIERLRRGGEPVFRGIAPVSESVKRLKVKATLDMEELLGIAYLLDTATSLLEYGKATAPEGKKDKISSYFEDLIVVPTLVTEIKRCIISADTMADDASAALSFIRKKIGQMDGRVHDELNAIINSCDNKGYLAVSNPTMRDGRYCLPVRAEYKKHFPGVTHDTSGSGGTLFIEPESVVKLNNEYQELIIEEKKEIEKILERLSLFAGEYAEDIDRDHDVLVSLDYIFAKAKYSRDIRAKVPGITTDGRVVLKNARHPLLPVDSARPVDIRLGDDFNILVVTGPNTGGKTVSLKTMGLLALMAMSGLPVPAESGTSISMFDELYADIGDEQSIEQSLSTFSSHMKNIVKILERVNERTMVLLDELCSGTDPTEGAALAASILDYMRERKVRAMATTHYAELKVYALTTDSVENACLEFNVETLSPTYRLLIGIPGKSNAFAISEKLGLKKAIVSAAKSRIDKDQANFEDLITDLEESRLTIEREREEIARLKDETKDLALKLKAKEEKLISSREKILREAKDQAADILKDAKSLADETIRDFRKLKDGSADMKQMEAKRTKVREAISEKTKDAGGRLAYEEPEQKKKLSAETIRVGDIVFVTTLGMDGVITALPKDDGKYGVQVGILKTFAELKELAAPKDSRPAESNVKNSKANYDKGVIARASFISPEIMLIGKTVDEALGALDKYLDDAYLSNLESVRIVHGKGSGALRDAVHRYLKKQSYVKKYHLGEYGEGDAGVTIVEFK